jgi:hypothetical protein
MNNAAFVAEVEASAPGRIRWQQQQWLGNRNQAATQPEA